MKLSARNQLKGTVKKISAGTVNAEVVVELAGGELLTAVITKASAKRLGLKRGLLVVAVVKAPDVMLGICCQRKDCDCGSHA